MQRGVERGPEDGRVEPRVARVDDDIDPMLLRERGDGGLVTRVDPCCGQAIVTKSRNGSLGPSDVEICQHHRVEERAATGDRSDGGANSAGSHHQDAHGGTLCTPVRAVGDRFGCRQAAKTRRLAPTAGNAAMRLARYEENHPA